MLQIKPRITQAQLEALTKARERLGKGPPRIYPQNGMDKATQFKILKRLRVEKEKGLMQRFRERKKARITKAEIIRIRQELAQTPPQERALKRKTMFSQIRRQLTNTTFPQNGTEQKIAEKALKLHRAGEKKTVHSFDTQFLHGKSKVRVIDLTTRMVTRELAEAAKESGINQEATNTFARLINSLTSNHQTVKKTSLEIYPPQNLLFIKLINQTGEQNARKALEKAVKRAVEIQKDANSISLETRTSDAFANIGPRISSIETILTYLLKDKQEFAKEAWEDYRKRATAISELKTRKGIISEAKLREIEHENIGFLVEIEKFMRNNGIHPTQII